MKYLNYILLPVVLNLFDAVINKTTSNATGNDLSGEMKTYYSDYLIDMAEPELVHDQFGQKHPIPKNGGKTIEFRKYDPLPKALTALTEGVTPEGQKLNMSTVTATVAQYGGFVELSDILLLTAIDNNLLQATKLLGSQAGRTLDTITREVLSGGTNVQYAEGQVDGRANLCGGSTTESQNHYLTVDAVRRAVRYLKVMNAPKINGYYAGIIHPDCSYDLMSDPKWVNVKTYSDPDGIYEGEIGKIEGVRFVETTEAKIFHAAPLKIEDGAEESARNLTAKSATGKVITIKEKLTDKQAKALTGRDILIGKDLLEVESAAAGAAGAATITTKTAPAAVTDGTVVYPGEGGANGRDVYSTLILGADAYGVTELEGGGLQHIVKQLGSSGTADPLNQRATAGWKLTKVAERLVEQYMVRIESASTFESGAMN